MLWALALAVCLALCAGGDVDAEAMDNLWRVHREKGLGEGPEQTLVQMARRRAPRHPVEENLIVGDVGPFRPPSAVSEDDVTQTLVQIVPQHPPSGSIPMDGASFKPEEDEADLADDDIPASSTKDEAEQALMQMSRRHSSSGSPPVELVEAEASDGGCQLSNNEKKDCGFPGISKGECEAMSGCCYEEVASSAPWCFKATKSVSFSDVLGEMGASSAFKPDKKYGDGSLTIKTSKDDDTKSMQKSIDDLFKGQKEMGPTQKADNKVHSPKAESAQDSFEKMLAEEEKKRKDEKLKAEDKANEEKDKADKASEKEAAEKKEKERTLKQEDEHKKLEKEKKAKLEEEKKKKEQEEAEKREKAEEEEERRIKLREEEMGRIKEDNDKLQKEKDDEAIQKYQEAKEAMKKKKMESESAAAAAAISATTSDAVATASPTTPDMPKNTAPNDAASAAKNEEMPEKKSTIESKGSNMESKEFNKSNESKDSSLPAASATGTVTTIAVTAEGPTSMMDDSRPASSSSTSTDPLTPASGLGSSNGPKDGAATSITPSGATTPGTTQPGPDAATFEALKTPELGNINAATAVTATAAAASASTSPLTTKKNSQGTGSMESSKGTAAKTTAVAMDDMYSTKSTTSDNGTADPHKGHQATSKDPSMSSPPSAYADSSHPSIKSSDVPGPATNALPAGSESGTAAMSASSPATTGTDRVTKPLASNDVAATNLYNAPQNTAAAAPPTTSTPLSTGGKGLVYVGDIPIPTGKDMVNAKTHSVEDMLKEPSVQDMLKEPSVQDMLKEPSVQDILKDPSVQDILKDPSVQDMLKYPSVQDMLNELPQNFAPLSQPQELQQPVGQGAGVRAGDPTVAAEPPYPPPVPFSPPAAAPAALAAPAAPAASPVMITSTPYDLNSNNVNNKNNDVASMIPTTDDQPTTQPNIVAIAPVPAASSTGASTVAPASATADMTGDGTQTKHKKKHKKNSKHNTDKMDGTPTPSPFDVLPANTVEDVVQTIASAASPASISVANAALSQNPAIALKQATAPPPASAAGPNGPSSTPTSIVPAAPTSPMQPTIADVPADVSVTDVPAGVSVADAALPPTLPNLGVAPKHGTAAASPGHAADHGDYISTITPDGPLHQSAHHVATKAGPLQSGPLDTSVAPLVAADTLATSTVETALPAAAHTGKHGKGHSTGHKSKHHAEDKAADPPKLEPDDYQARAPPIAQPAEVAAASLLAKAGGGDDVYVGSSPAAAALDDGLVHVNIMDSSGAECKSKGHAVAVNADDNDVRIDGIVDQAFAEALTPEPQLEPLVANPPEVLPVAMSSSPVVEVVANAPDNKSKANQTPTASTNDQQQPDGSVKAPPAAAVLEGEPQPGQELQRAETIIARLTAIEHSGLSETSKDRLKAPLEAMLWSDVTTAATTPPITTTTSTNSRPTDPSEHVSLIGQTEATGGRGGDALMPWGPSPPDTHVAYANPIPAPAVVADANPVPAPESATKSATKTEKKVRKVAVVSDVVVPPAPATPDPEENLKADKALHVADKVKVSKEAVAKEIVEEFEEMRVVKEEKEAAAPPASPTHLIANKVGAVPPPQFKDEKNILEKAASWLFPGMDDEYEKDGKTRLYDGKFDGSVKKLTEKLRLP